MRVPARFRPPPRLARRDVQAANSERGRRSKFLAFHPWKCNMSTLRWLGPALLATLMSTAVQAAVNVYFVQPSRYTDAWDWNQDGLDTLRELREHLQVLGQRY